MTAGRRLADREAGHSWEDRRSWDYRRQFDEDRRQVVAKIVSLPGEPVILQGADLWMFRDQRIGHPDRRSLNGQAQHS